MGLLALSGAVALAPRAAQACGGTFCDVNRGIPVNQVTETVLFALDGDTVEVHIQFNYTGEPERFAWVIPVPAEPTFEIGSQPLFDGLINSTQPTFTVEMTADECDEEDPPASSSPPSSGGGGGGAFSCDADFDFGGNDTDSFWDDDGDEEPEPEPEQLEGDPVGSFEVEILRPTSVAELERWLDANDYQRDGDAPEIFAKYIQEGHVFAGLKLRPGAGTDELHPIVMRYEGDEPCIPLRLTRIAAEEDMGVRAFFFGNARVAPLNYRHVELNPLMVDWARGGADYEGVVALAVDEGSNMPGRAFVTEYAGPTSVVDTSGLSRIWFPDHVASVPMEGGEDIESLMGELQRYGLVTCTSASCEGDHPLIMGILREFLPPPEGVEAQEYYRCPTCTRWQGIDLTAWDGDAFVQRIRDDIIGPTVHGRALVDRHPMLTRLYTRISPEEMLADPMFVENVDLPPVEFEHRAEAHARCDGVTVYTFEDGRELAVSGPWPWAATDWPAQRVELTSEAGAPVVEDAWERDIDQRLIGLNERTLEATGASVEAISIEWGGGIEPEDGCGRCRLPARDLSGGLWLGLIFGFVGWGRRRMMR